MKGLRPLHASQELKRDFFDNLSRPVIHTAQLFFAMQALFVLFLFIKDKGRRCQQQREHERADIDRLDSAKEGSQAEQRHHARNRASLAGLLCPCISSERAFLSFKFAFGFGVDAAQIPFDLLMLLAEHIRQLIQGKILEVYGFVLIAA